MGLTPETPRGLDPTDHLRRCRGRLRAQVGLGYRYFKGMGIPGTGEKGRGGFGQKQKRVCG